MQRVNLAAVGSTILLCFAIIVFPDQFLFSKTVPNSFWTGYFPLPFGADWFITFIALFPVIWFSESLVGAIKRSILVAVISVCLAVPVALLIIGGTLSANNLFNQYLWVGIICFPPLILQIVMRSLFSQHAKNG